MNLIEQFGYDAVKGAAQNYRNSGDNVSAEKFEQALLEYRRKHNIFEVRDKVVLLNWDNNNRLLTIKRVYEHKLYSDGDYCYSTFLYYVKEWSHDHAFSKRDIRHATNAEIKAGKRLEILRERT